MLGFKVVEYSLWSGTKDLTYMPLPFEARFVAKEYIDVFAYRAGKAGTALALTAAGLALALLRRGAAASTPPGDPHAPGGPGPSLETFDPQLLVAVACALTAAWAGVALREVARQSTWARAACP